MAGLKVAEMQFDEGNTTKLFKLADGHQYFIHRIQRDGKPDTFALMGAEPGMTSAFTAYVTEPLMDKVLSLRSSQDRAVDAVPDWVSDTGFTCPGCGAIVTQEGAHISPPRDVKPEPPKPEPEQEPAFPTLVSPKRRGSRFMREG